MVSRGVASQEDGKQKTTEQRSAGDPFHEFRKHKFLFKVARDSVQRSEAPFLPKSTGGFRQPPPPHCLRTLIRWRTVETSRAMPATQSGVTETARYVSVVLIRHHLRRSESEDMRILCALLGFFSGLVHLQRTATQAAASDRCGSLISLTRIGHLHEGEARGRPVFLSVTILTRSTAPWVSNRARNSCSVVLNARLPT